MTWWQAILLGALQGITEFLPISSSGHLVLAQHFLGFPTESKARGAALFFDGMLHLGTLLAVLVYFRRELFGLVRPAATSGAPPWPRSSREYLHLAVLVFLGTLPAVIAVLLASDHIRDSFEEPLPVAVNLLILGFILLLSDRFRYGKTGAADMRWWQALSVGGAQSLSAVFRGLSRSGMTITMALAVGLERGWAVRFSFLLSVIASLGLGGLGIVKALQEPGAEEWLTGEFVALALLGTLVSAVVGYLSIDPLIRLVRQARLWWFSVYLWLVGGSVLLAEYLSR